MDHQVPSVKDKSIEKGKKGVKKVIFGRTAVLIACLLVQILLLFAGMNYLARYIYVFFGGYMVFGLIILFVIINRTGNPGFQLSWAVIVLLFPIFGGLLYLYVEIQPGTRMLESDLLDADRRTEGYLVQEEDVQEELRRKSASAAQLASYLYREGGFPVYRNTGIRYFPSGEAKFEQLLYQLWQARKFIFMEYFIVHPGYMWNNVYEILKAKVREGVEVRFLYDGMNELYNVPGDFQDTLRGDGIQCSVFSPVYPVISTHYNNRDHRKIVVIDGRTAFTGGVNLADEYINRKERFGHWKDAAVMVQGDAVQSFTLMFLKLWSVVTGKMEDMKPYLHPVWDSIPEDRSREAIIPCKETGQGGETLCGEEKPDGGSDGKKDTAVPEIGMKEMFEPDSPGERIDVPDGGRTALAENRGFVQPYATNPFEPEHTAKRVYLDILNHAKQYVYIMTPYLVPDYEMLQALTYAARREVDVKIIMPHIPDKKYAFALAHSYYGYLTEAGVKIYEYTPGFVHSKVFVSDDVRAVVGAINLDYRSLFLNFECAAFLYGVPAIMDVKADVMRTLTKCQLITEYDIRHDKMTRKITGGVLKLVAPLL